MSIWKTLLDTARQLAASKKVMLAVISALVWAGGKFGLNLTPDQLLPLVAPLWGALAGQSVADIGKSAALIKADAKPAVIAAP